MTRDGEPWVPQTSSFSMLGPGHASFGWGRPMAGTPYYESIVILLGNFTGVGDLHNWEGAKTTFAGTFRLRHP